MLIYLPADFDFEKKVEKSMPKMMVTTANSSKMTKNMSVRLNDLKKPIATIIIDMITLRIVKGTK